MLKKCSFLWSKTGKNDVNIYYRANVIINLMNPNINRHKSPTQRFIYPNFTPYTPRVDKNGMHSSTQESTKEELSLREQQNLMREVDNVGAPINSGFSKVKKEDMHLAKNQINPQFMRNNSEKVFVYKPEIKLQSKINASPDKNYDYFGFKNGPKYHKDKFKNQHKLSDSADSEISHNSNKGQGKTLKFLTKKNQRKLDQGQLFKHENIVTKNKPSFLQQKSEIYRRAGGYQTRLQQQTPRNQSPSHSPSRKQDLTNPSNENTLYKRSSLSPQNKISLNRQISHQTIGVVKNNYTPKKSTTPLKMPHKDNLNQKIHTQIQKSFKQKNFYPKKQSESNQFSFCRQNLSIGHLNQQRKGRSILSLPLITVIPLSLVTSHPVSFIILDKLAQNKSSSIYKCLHSSTNMVYCIKKSAVQSNNISQLIIEHKIGTTFSHANLVKAFATFYDRSCLYLLMQYMQDRSLSNILRDGLCSREYYLRHSKSIQSMKFDTRQSFWQRPRVKEENFYSPYKNSEFLSSAAFTSHYPSDPHVDRLYFIKEILQQILRGLKFLHENGIMHRDLKPDNIFVSNGNYKIGDFGSCTYNESQEYIGTLDYAAPEIMLKQRYDKSVDMWSLGCLAYQLDVGSPPFYHENRGQTIRRIVNMQYNAELISDLQLKKFISKLLVRNIRITAADALVQVKKMEFGTSLNQMQMQRGWEK